MGEKILIFLTLMPETPKLISMEEYVNELIKYMDQPYFKNNPTYIDMWRKFYSKEKDANILLLLFNEEISTFYHWIYIEFSKKFVDMKRYDLAKFILNYALEKKVYDEEVIRKELKSIPEYNGKTKNLLEYFKRSTVKCMGRIFNIKDKSIQKIQKGSSKTSLDVKENNENECKNSRIDKATEKLKTKEIECLKAEFYLGGSILFDGFHFIINDEINANTFKTIRVAENDSAQPFLVVRKTLEINEGMFNNMEVSFQWENETYFCLKYDVLCTFNKIFKSEEFHAKAFKFYYIAQIYDFVMKLKDQDLFLINLNDLYVDTCFKLHLKSLECLSKIQVNYEDLFLEWFDVSFSTFDAEKQKTMAKDVYKEHLTEHKMNLLN